MNWIIVTYIADPFAVLSGEDDLRRLRHRTLQASGQLGVPAVPQLEGDREPAGLKSGGLNLLSVDEIRAVLWDCL